MFKIYVSRPSAMDILLQWMCNFRNVCNWSAGWIYGVHHYTFVIFLSKGREGLSRLLRGRNLFGMGSHQENTVHLFWWMVMQHMERKWHALHCLDTLDNMFHKHCPHNMCTYDIIIENGYFPIWIMLVQFTLY